MKNLRLESGNKLQRNRRGQFLILSALTIIIVMISFASLLASTSVLRTSLNRTEFREVAKEVTLNFRSAVGAAMAEVSRGLDYKASIYRYTNYTSLDKYPEAATGGYKFISDWQQNILQRYPGLGLNLSTIKPIFECMWNSSFGYSRASTNMSLDILDYGFYGWNSEITVELNMTILDLFANRTDGKTVAVYLQIIKEKGVPVTDLKGSGVSAFFQHVDSEEFTLSRNVNLTCFGDGYYLVEFSMYSTTILEGLNEIKEFAATNMTDEDFIPGKNSIILGERIDLVSAEYNASMLVEAYDNLTECKSWIIKSEDTTYVLEWIDLVRSQLLPTVRISLQDPRGIVVGAVRIFSDPQEGGPFRQDNIGPITRDLNVTPNPTGGASSVILTGWIDDLTTGLSNIADAEYFVDVTGQNGTGTKLLPSDGVFDSPVEEVEVVIDVSGWADGDYTIYVHGQDEAELWGGYGSITLTVTSLTEMYVDSIEMYLYQYRFPVGRLYQAEAVVRIVDINGNPVSGAMVYGHWNGPPGDVDGFTDANGMVSFLSERRWGKKTFSFMVYDVIKDGYLYNPDLNNETADSIRP